MLFPLPGTFFYIFLSLGNSLHLQPNLNTLLALSLDKLSAATKGLVSARYKSPEDTGPRTGPDVWQVLGKGAESDDLTEQGLVDQTGQYLF